MNRQAISKFFTKTARWQQCAVFVLAFLMTSLSADAKTKTKKKDAAPVSVTELKTERMTTPMSIDTPTPRLGWVIQSDRKNVMQQSCSIIVASTREKAM